MSITGKNNLGTDLLSKKGNQIFKAIDPTLNVEIEPAFYSATTEEVNAAVKLAREAFKTYREIPGYRKADFLDCIADEILKLGNSLISRAMQETALPKPRIEGERGRTIGQLKMFADLLREGSWIEASIDTSLPDRQPIPKPDIRKLLIPIGPVVVFGASNFPLAFSTAGGDTASALAAGNPVIVKAHNSHPGTSELVASAILKAAKQTGMPEGVFSHLQDNSFEAGKSLVMHNDVKAVAFTGSYNGGKALYDMAYQREEPIPVFAEMGSINPVFLLPGALKERNEKIAVSYASSITLGVGQFCTNPGLLIGLKSKEVDSFSKELNTAINDIVNAPMLNPGIYSNFESKKNKVILQSGVKIISGKKEQGSSMINQPDTVVAMVDSELFINNPTLHEEVFGPYSLLVQCDDAQDMLSIADQLKGQLTITVMATDQDLGEYKILIEKLQTKTGRLILNGIPTGVEVCTSMHHGGPFPATTDSRFTSVGTAAIKRFVRPLCFQNWPDKMLPEELKNSNPLNIWRSVNNDWTKAEIK